MASGACTVARAAFQHRRQVGPVAPAPVVHAIRSAWPARIERQSRRPPIFGGGRGLSSGSRASVALPSRCAIASPATIGRTRRQNLDEQLGRQLRRSLRRGAGSHGQFADAAASRASCRLATLAQAMSNTMAATPATWPTHGWCPVPGQCRRPPGPARRSWRSTARR